MVKGRAIVVDVDCKNMRRGFKMNMNKNGNQKYSKK